MAWILSVLLFFIIMIMVIYFLLKFVAKPLNLFIDNIEKERKLKSLEHNIRLKEHEKRYLERSTSKISDIKDIIEKWDGKQPIALPDSGSAILDMRNKQYRR